MFKKHLTMLLLTFLVASSTAFSQIVSPKQTEQYCLVIATAKLMSTKVNIAVDYGQETKFFGSDRGVVKDESGNAQKFNSVVDALNYMNSQGWEFVNAYSVVVGGQNVYNYLMRRRIN